MRGTGFQQPAPGSNNQGHAAGAHRVAMVLAVMMTILIQATTTRWLAERLGLLVEE
jgi:hypothetical protein